MAEELARSLEHLFDRDTFQLAPLLLANPKAARNQLSVFLRVAYPRSVTTVVTLE